jgi:hypothetical protein
MKHLRTQNNKRAGDEGREGVKQAKNADHINEAGAKGK